MEKETQARLAAMERRLASVEGELQQMHGTLTDFHGTLNQLCRLMMTSRLDARSEAGEAKVRLLESSEHEEKAETDIGSSLIGGDENLLREPSEADASKVASGFVIDPCVEDGPIIEAKETGVLTLEEQSSETAESLVNSSEHEEKSANEKGIANSEGEERPMEEHVRWLIKVKAITNHDIRRFFGIKKSFQIGEFVDSSLSHLIRKYMYWIDYPKGNRVLKDHSGDVHCAVITNDGRWLFTGSKDKSIIKWRLSDHSVIAHWTAHKGFVYSLAYCDSSLFSGSNDGTLRVWNLYSLELQNTLVGHKRAVHSISVNKRGTLMVSGSDDRSMRLWSITDGQCTAILTGHSNRVTTVRFLEDKLISGSRDKLIKLWNPERAIELSTIKEGIKNGIWDLSINCDGSLVACMFGSGFTA